MTRHNEWHRYFCAFPTLCQTRDEFYSCREGTKLVWLRTVWRQDIVRATYDRDPIYRYVDMEERPR